MIFSFSKVLKKIAAYCILISLYILGFEESPIIKKDDSITPIVQKEKIDYNKILKNLNNVEKQNYLHLIKENKNISEYTIQKYYGNFFHDYIHYISIKGSKDVQNVVALGIDKKFHISNSYLEGYAPFKTDKLWVPLQTIARKKTYQLDNLQYKGYHEIWQTSSQAFKYPRGDCEDHAIALADWLIEMGVDARVAIGNTKKMDMLG